jgi:hypothetical protein
MERWAANSLRVLGILVTVGATFIGSGILLLLSICAGAAQRGGSSQAVPFIAGAVVVVIAGVSITIAFARGLALSASEALSASPYAVDPSGRAVPLPPPPRPAPSQTLQLSVSTQQAVNRLVWAMGAQIVISIVCWLLNQKLFWKTPVSAAPRNLTLILLVPFLLYRVPYAILMYRFGTKPESRTFVYAAVVPPVLALQSVANLALVVYAYVHNPLGFVLLMLPWLLHFLVMGLAWKAIREAGVQPEASSLFTAGLVSYVYFLFVHGTGPLFFWLAGR